MDNIFLDTAHRQRFVEVMRKLDKIHDNMRYDQEYGAALYILTADSGIWNAAQRYVGENRGIDFENLFREVDFSGGYSVLIKTAWHLFNNGTQEATMLELLRLDEKNFLLAVQALMIRRYGYPMVEVDHGK